MRAYLLIAFLVTHADLIAFLQAAAAASLWAFLVLHKLAAFYFSCVLVEQLPPPIATSGNVYKYIYSVLQIFAANWQRTKDAVKA